MNEELTLEKLLAELLYRYNKSEEYLSLLAEEGRSNSDYNVAGEKSCINLLDSIFGHFSLKVTTDLISGEKVIVKR